jgi:hypothetical protein
LIILMILGDQRIRPGARLFMIFHNNFFYDEALLAPRPTPKPEDHPLSFVLGCLFSIFATTLHLQPEGMPCCGDKEAHLTFIYDLFPFQISSHCQTKSYV